MQRLQIDFSALLEKEMLRSSKGDLLIVPIDGRELKDLIDSKDRNKDLIKLVEKAILT